MFALLYVTPAAAAAQKAEAFRRAEAEREGVIRIDQV